MALYKKVSGLDDVMTFCGEKKLWGKWFVAAKNANKQPEVVPLFEIAAVWIVKK